MKYVVYLDGDTEHMVIFPRCINHDRMAEALTLLRFGGDRDWHRRRGEVISAGFVESNACVGRSETLGISSRETIDTGLLRSGGQRTVYAQRPEGHE